MSELYDLMILGAGPAGISAAIYAARAGLHTLWLDKQFAPGGQIINTYEVDNYPGIPGINGMELGEVMADHAKKLGISPVRENVLSIEDYGAEKILQTKKHEYRGKTLLLACGASHRKLNIPGEEELSGMGVSYCATCDGAFFRGKQVAVVGGGDVAVEDAIFLARSCEKVYLIHRRGELRAARSLQEALFKLPNVEVIWDTIVEKINGEEQVEQLELAHVSSGEKSELKVQGVFVAVGILPNSEAFGGLVEMDEKGYIKAGEEGETNIPGVYVAGDVRTKKLRQIITAAADGANAVTSAEKYIAALNF